MMTWIARLSTAVLTLLVLARAAAAQDYPPPAQASYAPAYGYADSRGAPQPAPDCCADYSAPTGPPRVYTPAYGAGQVQPSPGLGNPCCAGPPPAYGGGYGQTQGRPRIYVEDMYGQWHEATGEEYARVYAYAQTQGQPQSGYQYLTVPGPCCGQPPAYQPPPYAPPPCGGCCAPNYPPAPPGCPPSYPPGYGEVHLGDGFFHGGGGVGPEMVYSGGGGGYAYAGASSWASASASARVTVGGRGYRPPPHRPPPPRGGGKCGCH